MVWLGLCLIVLIEAYRGYWGSSDWHVEEGLAFEMMLLSFPASIILVFAFVATGMVLGFLRLALPASSKPEMTAIWLLFALAGYFQWFVVVPAIPRWWKKSKVNE